MTGVEAWAGAAVPGPVRHADLADRTSVQFKKRMEK